MARIRLDVDTNAKQAAGEIKGLSTALLNVNAALEIISRVSSTVIGAFESIVKEGAAFEQSLADINAVSKTFAKNADRIKKKALEIGSTTEFTATQAAGAFEELARAGVPVEKSLDSIDSLMSLASATGADLATSAQTVATTLSIFEQEALKADDAVNLMVRTVGASPQNFENLRMALKTSQGVAATLGISFEDLTQILGTFAQAGFRGEQAGTALNMALSRLASLDDSNEVLKKLGIAASEVNPQLVSFEEIIDKLRTSGAGFKDVVELLGQEAGTKLAKLVDQGSAAFQKFAKAQNEANDASTAQAEKLDTIQGKYKLLQSALSGLKINIFEEWKKPLGEAIDLLTKIVTKYSNFISEADKKTKVFDTIGQEVSGNFVLISESVEETLSIQAIALQSFERDVKAIYNAIVKTFEDIAFQIENAIGALARGIDSIMETALEKIDEWMEKEPQLKKMFQHIVNGINTVNAYSEEGNRFIGNFIDNLIDAADEALGVSEKVEKVVNKSKDVVEKVTEYLVDTSKGAQATFKAVNKKIKDIAQDGLNVFGSGIKKTSEEIAAQQKLLADKWTPATEEQTKVTLAMIGAIDGQILGLERAQAIEEERVKTQKEMNKAAKKYSGIVGLTTVSPTTDNRAQREYFKSLGEQAAGQVTGVSGAIAGFQQAGAGGAVAGFFMELLLSNEKMRAQINRLNQTLSEMLDPIVEELIPLFDAIIPILKELKPSIKAVAFWIKTAMPPLTSAIRELKPLITALNVTLGNTNKISQNLYYLLKDISEATLNPLKSGIDSLVSAINSLKDALSGGVAGATGGGGGGGILGGLGGTGLGGGAVGAISGGGGGGGIFHDGGTISRDDLFKFPGAKSGEGMIIAEEGETVIPKSGKSGNTFNFNIKAIDPRGTREEIYQLIEEGILTGRLAI